MEGNEGHTTSHTKPRTRGRLLHATVPLDNNCRTHGSCIGCCCAPPPLEPPPPPPPPHLDPVYKHVHGAVLHDEELIRGVPLSDELQASRGRYRLHALDHLRGNNREQTRHLHNGAATEGVGMQRVHTTTRQNGAMHRGMLVLARDVEVSWMRVEGFKQGTTALSTACIINSQRRSRKRNTPDPLAQPLTRSMSSGLRDANRMFLRLRESWMVAAARGDLGYWAALQAQGIVTACKGHQGTQRGECRACCCTRHSPTQRCMCIAPD